MHAFGKRHNDVIEAIIKKSRLKYKTKI